MSLHAYEFQVAEECREKAHPGTLLFVNALDQACWRSFLSSETSQGDTADEVEPDYVQIRHRCEYLLPGHQIAMLRMRLTKLNAESVILQFEHIAGDRPTEQIVARSEVTIACVREFGSRSLPAEWPERLRGRLLRLPVAGRPPQAGLAVTLSRFWTALSKAFTRRGL
jgi:acyl-CoA thioesterase FadM